MARPLTKCDLDGALYTRPQVVEDEIDGVLGQDSTTLRRRLAVAERRSTGYLSSECLVHLIREARRRGDQARISAVVAVLLSRLEANLLVKIPDGLLPNAADLREEVLCQFSELFATDGSEENPNDLDYFECRFNRAFRTFRIDLVRSEVARLKHVAPVPSQADDMEPDAYEDVFARVSDAFRSDPSQQSARFLNELWEAINALPPDECKAVVLCHMLGYKEESRFPGEATAATICKVEGRTIRYRLKRAAAKLSRFEEDA